MNHCVMSNLIRLSQSLTCYMKPRTQFLSPNLLNFSDMASGSVISFEDLKEQLEKKKVILIDVREPQELKDDGKIPGSLNIPCGKIEESFALSPAAFQERYGVKMPDTSDSNLVFSCKAGRRAASAAQKLFPLGYTKAKVYSGSFSDWVACGGPIEK